MHKLLTAIILGLSAPCAVLGQPPCRMPSPAALAAGRHALLQLRMDVLAAAGAQAACRRPRFCEPGPLETVLDVPGGWCEGLAVDHRGNVYTSDQVTEIVYRITPQGAVSEFARLFVMDNPGAAYAGTLGLEFSRDGDLCPSPD